MGIRRKEVLPPSKKEEKLPTGGGSREDLLRKKRTWRLGRLQKKKKGPTERGKIKNHRP